MLRDTCDLKQFREVRVIRRTFSRQSMKIIWDIALRGLLTVLTTYTERDDVMRDERTGESENERATEKEWRTKKKYNKI